MAKVRIYRPAKSAMQSGRANTRDWLVEFAPADRETPDPLMGWNGSHDTLNQVKLWFQTKEQAVAFAQKEGHEYTVEEEYVMKPPRPKSYADNFRFDKTA